MRQCWAGRLRASRQRRPPRRTMRSSCGLCRRAALHALAHTPCAMSRLQSGPHNAHALPTMSSHQTALSWASLQVCVTSRVHFTAAHRLHAVVVVSTLRCPRMRRISGDLRSALHVLAVTAWLRGKHALKLLWLAAGAPRMTQSMSCRGGCPLGPALLNVSGMRAPAVLLMCAAWRVPQSEAGRDSHLAERHAQARRRRRYRSRHLSSRR